MDKILMNSLDYASIIHTLKKKMALLRINHVFYLLVISLSFEFMIPYPNFSEFFVHLKTKAVWLAILGQRKGFDHFLRIHLDEVNRIWRCGLVIKNSISKP